MKIKKYLINAIVLLALLISGGCSVDEVINAPDSKNPPTSSSNEDKRRDGGQTGGPGNAGNNGDGEGDSGEEGDNDGGSGDNVTTTEQGNGIVFNLGRGAALVLTSSSGTGGSNLKKIEGAELQDAISFAQTENGSVQGLHVDPDDDLPRVSQMYFGPDGVVVLALKDRIHVGEDEDDEEYCRFIRLADEGRDLRCIDPDIFDYSLTPLSTPQHLLQIPGGHRVVQFDDIGNIYYRADTLRRWNLEDGSIDELTNKNIYLQDYLVSGIGEVLMKGRTLVGGTTFFRRFKTDGSLEELLAGNVVNFSLVDGSHLLVAGFNLRSGSETTGLFLLTIGPAEEGLEILMSTYPSINNPIEVGHSYYSGWDTTDFQKSGSGKYYGLVGSGCSCDSRKIIEIYPETPSLTDVEAESVTYFHVIDEDIYYFGLDENNRHLFRKVALREGGFEEEDLIGGQNIQIYHFVVVNEFVYFDGLRFSDSKLIFGRIDQNNGNELTELSELEASLLDLQFME